jgi:hypothetical protein
MITGKHVMNGCAYSFQGEIHVIAYFIEGRLYVKHIFTL